jgi:hypothetical protein
MNDAQKVYRTKYNEYRHFDINGYWIEVTKNGNQWFQRHVWDTVNEGLRIDNWVHSYVSERDLEHFMEVTCGAPGLVESYNRRADFI